VILTYQSSRTKVAFGRASRGCLAFG
jgi:hypothetical protein